MKRAEKHLPIIKSQLEVNPRFKGIRLVVGTGLNGCIMVTGTVPANKDIIELKNIISKTNPPVIVFYAVYADDIVNWVDLSDGLKCLIGLEKNIFAISETITVDVFIRNSTDKEWGVGGGYYYVDPEYGPLFRSGIMPILKDSGDSEIKPTKVGYVKYSSAGGSIKQGESDYFSFNLTDCYRLDKTGEYSFCLSFTKKYSGFTDGQSNTVEFEIVNKQK
ncbi:MAG: hypothetical protein V1701_03615 [Planctomycetota bacterium]